MGRDRDQVIEQDSHRPRLARIWKKIDVGRWRLELDRKGEIEEDGRELRLTKR